VAHRLVNCFR